MTEHLLLLQNIKADLKKLLHLEQVTIRPGRKGFIIFVEDFYGDIDSAEFKQIAQDTADEISTRVAEKWRGTVEEVVVRNLDTSDRKIVNATVKVLRKTSTASRKQTRAAAGESRDEVTEILSHARTSMLDALDSLYSAKHLIAQTISQTAADTLDNTVIKYIDSVEGEDAALDGLHKMIQKLHTANLKYDLD